MDIMDSVQNEVRITGFVILDFEAENGDRIQGAKVYYLSPLSHIDPRFGGGCLAGEMWVAKQTALYSKLPGYDYSRPFSVSLQVVLGAKGKSNIVGFTVLEPKK